MLRASHRSFSCRNTLLGEPWPNPDTSWPGRVPSTCQVWWSSWVWNRIRSDLKALPLDNAQDGTINQWKEQEWRWLLRLKAQITDPRHSKTPVQENTPRKDAAFPRNKNDPLTFLYGIWDCLPFPSRRRQSWPWTVFAACWRPEMLSTLQNLAPEMWTAPEYKAN